ncbi:hypothetical protein B0H17DRAFT_1208413 [Mycena rosella]|uniref:Retrotransposon gag domain-containing protein n=1 Tax=Mycena rosella TaxID=1033263 RepID=A0AAD7GAT4_MYCRO|nr:hypothetical protein B0H17DRAFT_1208413 [Mycena rosella]
MAARKATPESLPSMLSPTVSRSASPSSAPPRISREPMPRLPTPRSSTPPPHRTIDSSSDSDSSPARPNPDRNMSSTHAVVKAHSTKPPTLTKGILSPLVVNEFVIACINYHDYKDTADNRKVKTILRCFADPRVKVWLGTKGVHEQVSKMKFEDFMIEFKKRFLPPDWELTARNDLLKSRMKDAETFSEWATEVQVLNALLVDTKGHFDLTRMRHILEAGMVDTLQRDYGSDEKAKAIPLDDFDAWLTEVIRLDVKRVYDRKKSLELATEQFHAEKCKMQSHDEERATKKAHGEGHKPYSKPNSSASASSSHAASSSSFTPLPKLTKEEKELLRKHRGCNKCRVFYAGHYSNDCTTGYPDAATYKALTAADADKAVAATKQPKSSYKPKPVAVVMPPIEDDSDSADSEEDLDRSVSPSPNPAPIVEHFYWDCLVEGPATNLPLHVIALMDNSSHLVLIDEDLVQKMEMRRRKLHEPQSISLAVGTDSSSSTTITEYVKLCTISLDQTWVSRIVRALVVPGLCAPIIWVYRG